MFARPRRELHQSAQAGATAALRVSWVVRVLVALLLLPAIVSGGSASARALLRCEVTQQMHASCCCPTSQLSPAASISRSCCTRVEVDQELPSGSVRNVSEVVPPLLAALLPVWRGFGSLPPLELAPDAPSSQQAPPPPTHEGPSLIVLHRRFLI
ncbi:MAG: hypothetical protein JWN04_1761 [Myxococcaceae bacterium]|nr:hypothetical protein [Myxococcaceae bacterium]